jgi:hypothetical protein
LPHNKNRKIKPTAIPAGGTNIPAPRLPPDAELRFSFKLIDLYGNTKFGVRHCAGGYLEKLLTRLQDVNRMKVSEFRGVLTKQIRNHKIEFADTSEPMGFTMLNKQLQAKEPWQFEITANAHGRVHGILIDDVFFVIWIDPCHNLYAKGNQTCGH